MHFGAITIFSTHTYNFAWLYRVLWGKNGDRANIRELPPPCIRLSTQCALRETAKPLGDEYHEIMEMKDI